MQLEESVRNAWKVVSPPEAVRGPDRMRSQFQVKERRLAGDPHAKEDRNQLVEPACGGARRGVLPRIETGARELPIRITRMSFLMGNKCALTVFGRDCLEARRAD